MTLDPWPQVLIPAVVLTLVVRIDAKLLGPYFAFSELVPGFGGDLLVGESVTKAALNRRFLYPLLVGVVAHLFGASMVSLVAIGACASGLLLWPLVFHKLPKSDSGSVGLLISLYVLLVISYALLSLAGGWLIDLMKMVGGGNLWKYVSENFLNWLVTALAILVITSVYRGVQNRIRRNRNAADR